MQKIYWKKLSGFGKVIFSLGWISVLSLLFWIVMLIYYFAAKEKKFWTPGSYRVVYVFGWINLVSLLLVFLIGITWVVVRNMM